MGKGNGKTPLASWVGAYELAGAAHSAPHVIIGASSLKQANLVFGDLRTTCKESKTLAPFVEPFDLQILLKNRPGVAERIAADAGTADGARATAFIADELHEWDSLAASRLYMVVEGALKKPGAFSLAISTAGWDPDTVLGKLYGFGKQVATGEKVDDGLLFEWYEAPPGLDLDAPDEWMEAVMAANPAAGDFNSLDYIKSRFDGALRMPRYEFERYHLNRWTASPEQWLPPGAWDNRATGAAPEPSSDIMLGFSGTYNSSSAALVGCTLEGHVFVLGCWDAPADEKVPRSNVEAAVSKAMKDYRVIRLACNPPGWENQVEEWSETYGSSTVVLFEIRKRVRFVDACTKFYTGVVNGGLSHDGDPRLARHLSNVRVKVASEGAYITSGPHPVTAATAAVLAYEQAITSSAKEPLIAWA